ncbi:MAG: ADP-ribosylglycohydrolase family protein [Clostridia bacterium]|nr:ADP-ribosylglycohydrolase family protein [Clostridia bacterium]
MKLSYNDYLKKMRGCWSGKNCGGTLGAPYECHRGVFDITDYPDNLNGEMLPNDDLDLQLLWLNAAEKYGRHITSEILSEYWLDGVIADLSEYGVCRANLRRGILPPLSGYYNNPCMHSNGAFIFSEIWACLNPGNPINAVKYAFEDASVDHSGEGLYAAVFCTALESAAFVESDIRKLINIALSYIPDTCDVAKGINTAINAYDSGLDWKQARKKVLQAVPGSFGAICTPIEKIPEDEPVGPKGYDAPSNLGIIAIGLLYGEGDFGKSICIAASCGEDTDCTASTVGAMLGIIYGEEGIGERWLKPIGNTIKTCIVNRAHGYQFPATVDELVSRVARLVPEFLKSPVCYFNEDAPGFTVEVDENDLYCKELKVGSVEVIDIPRLLEDSPFTVKKCAVPMEVKVKYQDGIYLEEDKPLRFEIEIFNRTTSPKWFEVKWWLPECLSVSPSRCRNVSVRETCQQNGDKTTFTITPHGVTEPVVDALLEVSMADHPTTVVFPIRFLV